MSNFYYSILYFVFVFCVSIGIGIKEESFAQFLIAAGFMGIAGVIVMAIATNENRKKRG